ncbi:unnamed protein product, partial [Ixodes persulcatus]
KNVPSVAPENKTCIASSSLSHPSLPRPAPSLDRSLPRYDRPKPTLSQPHTLCTVYATYQGTPPVLPAEVTQTMNTSSGTVHAPNPSSPYTPPPPRPPHSPHPLPPGRNGSLTPHTASSPSVTSWSISPGCLKISPQTPLHSPSPLTAGIGTI